MTAAAFFVARLLIRRGGAEPSARRGVSRFGNAAGGDLGGEHVPAQEGQRVVARVDARARDPAREGRPRDGEGDLVGGAEESRVDAAVAACLLYTSPSPRDS